MATSSINKFKGLQTFPNFINGEPSVYQNVVTNVVIDRDNIIEPRRGMKVLTDIPEYSKQLLTYKDRVLCHYGNSLGYLNTSDPGYVTTLKGTSTFTINSSTTNITIVDHNLSIGDGVFFSKLRDHSGAGYFTLPTGIDEVSAYVIYTIIDKDTFQISTSTLSSPITLSGSNAKATIVYDFIVNEVKSQLRIKYIELNSSLYFTTSDGIKKVSQLNPYAISRAGGITALNLDLSLAFSGSGGYFGPITPSPLDVEVAYRIVWGTKDVNNNLILGKPSERAFIQNYTRQNTDVVVSFPVPQGITTAYFYQIYRTNVFTIDGSGDEMRLVIESPYDGYSSNIIVTDSTPEVIRDTGTPLYTNELSGEGILQSNDRPPVCEDICVYKNRAWFANTKSSQKLDVTFLGFDGFRDPITAPVAVGNPATFTIGANHGVSVGDYIALANTTSVDGQYIVTAITTNTITVNVNSASLGATYVLYRTYVTVAKNTQLNRYFFVGKPEVTNIVAKNNTILRMTPSIVSLAINNTQQFTATGGAAPYTYSVFSGVGTINASTGLYTAPASSGSAVVKVTDAYGASITTNITISTGISISPSTLTVATNGTFQFSASGTLSQYTYSIVSGSGVVTSSGAFTAAATAGVTVVRVTDAYGNTSTSTITANTSLGISPAILTLTPTNKQKFIRNNGVANFTFSIVSGGGTINSSTGDFVAPLTSGVTVVRITDSTSATADVTVTIANTLAIIPNVTTITVNDSVTFTHSGGVSPIIYTLQSGTGTLDPDLGYFIASDTPGAVVVRATDSIGNVSDCRITVSVSTATPPYFNLTSIDDKIKYSFWIAKTVTDVAPIVSGRVLFKVDLYTNPATTADEVRDRIKDALNTTGDFFCVNGINPGEMTIATITVGAVTDAVSATQVGGGLVSIVKSQDGFGENASLGFVRLSSYASPASAIEDTAKSLVKVISSTASSPVYAYYLATTNSLPGQFYLEEKNYSGNSFSLLGTGFSSNVSFNPVITTAVSSTNNIGNNVLMFSKTQQPESVPTVNSFKIGPQDKAIKRILGLRDSLFIFKEEGVYRLTGENESTFNIALFDNSATIIAPDSAVVLNNQIYCITTQGVSSVSETGVGIISRNIENIFNRVSSENYPNFNTATYGISYEADRAYILATVENEGDVTATKMYRYNSFTRTWTTFDKSSICGVVSVKNKLHLGADDVMSIEIERKKLTVRDYVDREYTRTTSALSGNKMYLDNASDLKVGDSLTQRQYTSVNDFNNLTSRLKLDPQLGFNAAFPKLTDVGGADFSNAISALVFELNLKDATRVSQPFTSTASNVITIPNHGFEENDIVTFTSSSPVGLSVNTQYRAVSVTANTLSLTSLVPNILIKNISTIGLGTFTSISEVITFNVVKDIDYVNYTFVIPDHGLVDGAVITYTNNTTPVTTVAPTGLQHNRSYKVINSTSSVFQIIEVKLDLNASENGTLTEIYYYSGETDNARLQREYNDIINSLNNSSGIFFSNYEISSGYEDLDMLISSINASQNYVTIQYASPFYIGTLTHYKSIVSEVEWDYFPMGDPSLLKHVSEGTLMVEQNSLDKLTLGYASDLSGDFENVTFTLDGDGSYGKALFGETAFGGNGTSYPLRTLIPRQKQRCRYIKTRMYHDSAWSKFGVVGISYRFEITSERAYRR